MSNYAFEDLFTKSSVNKQLKVVTDDETITITNSDIHSENFTLNESLCSEKQLKFGACEASCLTLKFSNIFTSLKDKWITVTESLEGATEDFRYGRYKVVTDTPTADRRFRTIKAYDAMQDIINANVADWYNELLPNADSTTTMKTFRTSFISHFGLTEEDITLVNDNMIIERTITPSELSGKVVANAICEINGCFGHINRQGNFEYIYLEPISDANEYTPTHYIKCEYEDYVTQSIDKLQIRQEENDIGAVVGEGNNCYVIEDNFLVYGKNATDLQTIATNIYNKITGLSYRPYKTISTYGNPCQEVGTPIKLVTTTATIESYILQRTLSGIQSLRDVYSAKGTETFTIDVNSANRQIIQLKGKTNTLERTVEETKSTITDVENNLQSQITQNANQIALKVSKGDVSSQLSVESGQVTISGNRLVVDSTNFKLDKNGNVVIYGDLTSNGGIYLYSSELKDTFKLLDVKKIESADDYVVDWYPAPSGDEVTNFYNPKGECIFQISTVDKVLLINFFYCNSFYARHSILTEEGFSSRYGMNTYGPDFLTSMLADPNSTIFDDNIEPSPNTHMMFFRNDGSNFYILVSDKNPTVPTYNSLRPFFINFATGRVYMNEGLRLLKHLQLSDNGSTINFMRCGSSVLTANNATSATIVSTATISSWAGITSNSGNTVVLISNGDGNAYTGHVEGATLLNGYWYATWASSYTGSIRINWIVIVFGG